MKKVFKSGFSFIELFIVLSILAILIAIILSTFVSIRKNEALNKDTENIVQILRQARSETLTSQNASQYGVHFSAQMITIYTGPTYSSPNATNRDFILGEDDSIITINLASGGNNIIFNRLTGETNQNGIIVVSSPTTGRTKTVTVYKTGLVESN